MKRILMLIIIYSVANWSLFAQNIEGILYIVLQDRMVEKEKEYNKMPLKNIEQIKIILQNNATEKHKMLFNTLFLNFNNIYGIPINLLFYNYI